MRHNVLVYKFCGMSVIVVLFNGEDSLLKVTIIASITYSVSKVICIKNIYLKL